MVMAAVAVATQPLPSVPVTVYVVEPEGLAFTDVPVVADNPAEGDHAYVVAPPAVKAIAGAPLHNVEVAGVAVTTGNAFTVTLTVEVDEVPQLSVTTIVYVPVAPTAAPVITGFWLVEV